MPFSRNHLPDCALHCPSSSLAQQQLPDSNFLKFLETLCKSFWTFLRCKSDCFLKPLVECLFYKGGQRKVSLSLSLSLCVCVCVCVCVFRNITKQVLSESPFPPKWKIKRKLQLFISQFRFFLSQFSQFWVHISQLFLEKNWVYISIACNSDFFFISFVYILLSLHLATLFIVHHRIKKSKCDFSQFRLFSCNCKFISHNLVFSSCNSYLFFSKL